MRESLRKFNVRRDVTPRHYNSFHPEVAQRRLGESVLLKMFTFSLTLVRQ